MKKTLLAAMLFCTIGLTAQTSEKEVTLSLKHHELLLILTKSNSFDDWVQVPEKVTEVYECGKLQYIKHETDDYILKIMPDDEFRIERKKIGSDYISDLIFLRFPNKTIYGYSMGEKKDGTITVSTYKGGMGGIHDYLFKPSK